MTTQIENQYTIQEVAQKTGLSAHTLRYYERIGLIHPIHRAENTHRRYGDSDIGWIEFLNKLRATGMPIQLMQQYAELQRMGDESLSQRLAILKAHRDSVESCIADLEKNLEVVYYKIDLYQGFVDEKKKDPCASQKELESDGEPENTHIGAVGD